MISILIPALLGLAIGGLLVGLPAAARLREMQARLAQTERHVAELETQLQRARDKYSSSVVEIAKLNERLDAETRLAREKLALLENARAELAEALKTLSRSLPEPAQAHTKARSESDPPTGAADLTPNGAQNEPAQPVIGTRPKST